mmetsp:Transcript_15516/g.29269  ORF Transcript_15516/g.29269 Transcript_15516/m.29269 type:complete len:668 (-) Transcript_15516:1848-3851(-)|eukprot:CAMPEP_0176490918 /NCGR_PEP_ID=MMETSP0200_2-20121128/8141_1 /TAXON_ID=947934 /ORGANISM="Chaetoceros sp., Strain GSL56" /LENGTH=667 /DNA_ID=CAMNT_0017888285 /DNA_START=71 /DNA_END=2074 /DNA_ORIENTATION=+
MDIDDHDKHLLAMIDARRPSTSSSNRTSARTGGVKQQQPKIKRKVTFSDPLTSSTTSSTTSSSSIHENGISMSRSPVLLAGNSDIMAGNDQNEEASEVALLNDTKRKNTITSNSAADDHDHIDEDVPSSIPITSRLLSNQQQQPSQEFNISSFSRFSSSKAGSKYDFQSVEDLLKSDSLSTTTSAKTSSTMNLPREQVTTPSLLNLQQQQYRTDTDTSNSQGPFHFDSRQHHQSRMEEETAIIHERSKSLQREDGNSKMSNAFTTFSLQERNIPTSSAAYSAINNMDTRITVAPRNQENLNFDGTIDRTIFATNSNKRGHLSSNTVAGGASSSTATSSNTKTNNTSYSADAAENDIKDTVMNNTFGMNTSSVMDPSIMMEHVLEKLKNEIKETYRHTVAETSQTMHNQLCASISEENAMNREQILSTMEHLDTMLKTVYDAIQKGNEHNQLEEKRLSMIQEELRQERAHLVRERKLIDQERRNVEDLKRKLEQESTRRNSYLERKEEELNSRYHDIEKERIDIENQKASLEKDKIEMAELKDTLKVEAKDLRDQRMRVDIEDANLNDERRRIQHMAEEISYLGRKIALEKASAEEDLAKARKMKEDAEALIIGISEKQKELATGYDDIQKKEQALRFCKMDLARQRVDFLKERVQQRNTQQHQMFMM